MTLAAVLSAAVGLSLGILGGGGSILALPILVYAAGIAPADAVGMSLVLVGATAALGSLAHARRGNVDGRTALLFGAAGLPGAIAGSQLTALVAAPVLLGLFALLMLVAGAWMVFGRMPDQHAPRSPAVAAGAGLGVGVLTGFLGVGGGFVIVPALTALAGLELRRAIGTSLVVIAMNSASGVVGHLHHGNMPLGATIVFTAAAVGGAVVGERVAGRLRAAHLRRGFAAMVLVVGALIGWQAIAG